VGILIADLPRVAWLRITYHPYRFVPILRLQYGVPYDEVWPTR